MKDKRYISGICKTCKSAYGRRHYQANIETYQLRAERWAQANKRRAAKNKKEYRERNRESLNARDRRYRAQNREQKHAYWHKHYQEHREKILARRRERYKKNRHKESKRGKIYREKQKIRYGSAFPLEAIKPLVEQAVREKGSIQALAQATGIDHRSIARTLNGKHSVLLLESADAICLATEINLDEFTDASEEWSRRTGIEWPSRHFYVVGNNHIKRQLKVGK